MPTNGQELIRITSEIFKARAAVGAERGDKDALTNTVTVDGYKTAGDLENNAVFREFMQKHGTEVSREITNGHGGAAEKISIYTELMAARQSVGSIRGSKSSLNRQMRPKTLNETVNKLKDSQDFNNMMNNTDPEVLRKKARSGHGGELDDLYREHFAKQIAKWEAEPKDIDPRFLPTVRQLLKEVQNDANDMKASYTAEDYEYHTDTIKEKAAGMMYLVHREKQHFTEDNPLHQIEPKEMETRINKLKSDDTFTWMFDNLGAQRITSTMADSKTGLITKYTETENEYKRILGSQNGHPSAQKEQPGDLGLYSSLI